MTNTKSKYAYILKSIKKDVMLKPITDNLKGKTYIISGGTRGIGFNIAKKLAIAGANVTITGKTTIKHPKLEGTIFTAAEDICDIVKDSRCIGIPCDIRKSQDIDFAVKETISIYGNIDGVVLNASALCLNDTLNQTEKEVKLMSSVNINGSYLFGQKCLQHMHKNNNGHMIVIAPPIYMLYDPDWWTKHLYYTMSKFNMTLMAKFWNKEFNNIAVNTLWPRTTIATAPVKNLLGGDEMINISRTPDIMGDAAKHIFFTDPTICNGKNFIDDEILCSLDIDVEKYRVNKNMKEKELMPDFFC